jgi:hypothetical protein
MHLFLMINFVGIEPPKATKLRVETRPKPLKQFVSSYLEHQKHYYKTPL